MAMMADGKDTWQFDAVVLCAGDFPTHDIPLCVLRDAPYLCCCDGAAVQAVSYGLRPDAIVGDGDSLPDDFKRQYSGIIHLVSEQEYNDMTKATRHCIRRGARRIAYVGATGKREDHTIGNLSLLMEYARELGGQGGAAGGREVFVDIVSDWSSAFAITDTSDLNIGEGRSISIICPDNSLKIKSKGLVWPTDNVVFDNLWKATLNRAETDCIRLEFSHPSIALIILN